MCVLVMGCVCCFFVYFNFLAFHLLCASYGNCSRVCVSLGRLSVRPTQTKSSSSPVVDPASVLLVLKRVSA